MRCLLCLLPAFVFLDGSTLVRVQEQDQASLWIEHPVADSLTVKLSEKLTVVMRVAGAAPLDVELEDNPRPNEGWQLEAVHKPKTTTSDDGKQALWEQTFLAWPQQPGTHPLRLPGFKFTENGGTEQVVAWEPLEVKITTRVAKVDATEVRERTEIELLPPQPEVPAHWWPWLLALVPMLALTVAGVVYSCRRRRLPLLSPRDAALRTLAELEKQTPLEPGALCAWHVRLADALRQYVEQQLDWPATRRTTAEFMATPALTLPTDQLERLKEILELCDVAKFAGATAGPEQRGRLLGIARAFVEETRGP